MDNIITGIFGVGLFLLFIIGLAESIGSIAFGVIVATISVMALYDLYQNIRDARRQARDKAARDSTLLD